MKKQVNKYSVIFDLVTGNLFHYTADTVSKIHEIYGGKCYYRSNSGNKINGYLTTNLAQLVDLGWYAADELNYEFNNAVQVSEYFNDNGLKKPIYAYAPFENYKLTEDFPIVVTDRKNVVFCNKDQLKHCLVNFDIIIKEDYEADDDSITIDEHKIYQKPLPLLYYASSGYNSFTQRGIDSNELYFYWYKGSPCTKVNALRFCDLTSARSAASSVTGFGEYNGPVSDELNIMTALIRYVDHSDRCRFWLHRNKLGYFDECWVTNPLLEEGSLPEEWYCLGERIVWRREGIHVKIMIDGLVPPQYCASHVGEWVGCERRVTAIDWFSTPLEEWKESIKSDLMYKIKGGLLGQKIKFAVAPFTETYDFLREFSSVRIDKAQAYEYTECINGVNRFIKKFNLPDKLSIGELIMLDSFPEMMEDMGFRKFLCDILLWDV